MAKLNVFKRTKNENYFTASNEILKNKNISLKAKGLHCLITGLPDDWDFSVAGIISIVAEGKAAVYAAVDELITYGYCVKTQIRENGRFKGCTYNFVECLSDTAPFTENQETINQETINQETINRTQSNTKLINHEINEINKEKEERERAHAREFEKINFLSKNENFDSQSEEVEIETEKIADENFGVEHGNLESSGNKETFQAFDIYCEYYPTHTMNGGQYEIFRRRMPDADISVWRKTLDDWKLNGYKASNISGLIDYYHNKLNQKGEQINEKSKYGKRSNADTRKQWDELAGDGLSELIRNRIAKNS